MIGGPMVRHVRLALVAASLAATAVVPAGAATARTVTAPYRGAGGVYGVQHGDIVVLGEHTFGAAVVPTRAGERTVQLVVADTTGLPVFFEAVQYSDPRASRAFVLGTGCGKTDRPLRIALPARPVVVVVAIGACGSGTSVPTAGVVTATLR